MPHSFVIVEDDHLQEGPLADYIAASFPGALVTTLGSEHEFRDHVPSMQIDVPDLVLMDVMLRWTFPSPTAPPPPPDVVEGGYYRAGLRCAMTMQHIEQLRRVPIVLYTILERSDLERDSSGLPPNVTYVGKTADTRTLIDRLKTLLGSSPARLS